MEGTVQCIFLDQSFPGPFLMLYVMAIFEAEETLCQTCKRAEQTLNMNTTMNDMTDLIYGKHP